MAFVRKSNANWNLGDLAASPKLAQMNPELRIELLSDGTVTKIEPMNDQPGNPEFRRLVDSAMRAVMISSPLKLPAGKTYTSLTIHFHPGKVVQGLKPHNCHDLAAGSSEEPHRALFVPATGPVGKGSGDQYKSRPIGRFGEFHERNPKS